MDASELDDDASSHLSCKHRRAPLGLISVIHLPYVRAATQRFLGCYQV